MPAIPPDADEVIFARRLVAQRCLYGIDRNPMAVDLAKVSRWLSTLARDHPLTFVDHAFRRGDSLVGLTRRQIEALDWAANARSPQRDFKAMRVGERMAEAAELRRCIREAGEEASGRELHDLWHDAHDGLDPVRLSGDPVLAAFFAETKPKPREARRRELAKAVLDGEAIRYLSWLEELRRGNPPLAPFYWEIEFPEVFGRENPGFDAFVGNPPFAGKNAVAAGNVPGYPDLRHVINFRDWPLRREDIGDSREGIGESREDSGESRADADDERDRHPSRPERVGGLKADAERRYPGRREDGAESWMDTDEERRRELRRQPIVSHDYPEPVAADWLELLAIVEERVKPGRAHLTRNDVGRKRAMFWWQYGSLAKELYTAVAGLDRVLAISRVGQHAAFTFLPKDRVYAESMIIFPFTTHSAFCALQSRPHELWARFFGSSMKDDLRYTPSDCFETFPFPESWEAHPALEAAGREHHDFRAALMVTNGEGMTKTCNRFHDPDESDPRITELRDLHAAMDRAVLDAYGWHDIPTDCDFLLDHEIDEAARGRKKKPCRYRWPDPIRDEVLARLLALNADRGAAEARTGSTSSGGTRRPSPLKPGGSR